MSELMGKLSVCDTEGPRVCEPQLERRTPAGGSDSKHYIVVTSLTKVTGPANPLPSTSAVATYPMGPSLVLMGSIWLLLSGTQAGGCDGVDGP